MQKLNEFELNYKCFLNEFEFNLIMESSCASSPKAIAIVGGGFSGSLVATHLLKNAHHPLKVFLIERGTAIGQGIAYGTPHKEHLLNVPVGKMSAFPENPDHLLCWLRSNPVAWGMF